MAAKAATCSTELRDELLEMRVNGLLDLDRRTRLFDPEHDANALLVKQVLAGVEEVLREIGIEIAVSKRRRVAIVEHLLDRF
ncbi:MAG: hypothetical protein ABI704_05860 [Kofleriaceae bacterium]